MTAPTASTTPVPATPPPAPNGRTPTAAGGLRAIFEYNLIGARRYLKVALISQLGAPVLFVLSLGLGLGSVINSRGGADALGVRYLVFLAPALIATTALQVGAVESTYPIMNGFKWARVFFAMNTTPLSAAQIARGTLLFLAARTAVSSLVYLGVVACFGGFRTPLALLDVPIATLGAMAFAAPVVAWASTREGAASFNFVFRFLVTPMFLFSGTFYSIDRLPRWAQALAWISPLWHSTELCRWVALAPLHLSRGVGSVSTPMVVVHLLVLLVPAVVGSWLAGRMFARQLSR